MTLLLLKSYFDHVFNFFHSKYEDQQRVNYSTVNISRKCVVISSIPTSYRCNKNLDRRHIQVEYRGLGKYWQSQMYINTSDAEERVYGMHAYYDDRSALMGKVYIRMFVVVTERSEYRLSRSSFCHLWTECSDSPLVMRAYVTDTNTGRQVNANGKLFTNYILSCFVPPKLVSHNITISHASFVPEACINSTILIPVTYPVKPEQFQHRFGMCEANGVSFGHFGPEQAAWLIEWFETNMLFGISEFNIYNSTMTICESVRKVLQYYQDEGLLHIYQQPPPLLHYSRTERDVADIAMRTALNDCMYRNMYRYQYAITIDLDEVIVPNRHNNYSAVIDKLEKTNDMEDTKPYTIQALAFFQKFTDTDEKLKSKYPLRTVSYMNAVNDDRKKTFFNPRLCLGAFSHKCFVALNSTEAEKVETTDMVVHHYRNQCIKFPDPSKLGPKACRKKEKQKHFVGRMLNFQEKVFEKVSLTAGKLGIPLS